MTTIAYRDGIMAADRRAFSGGKTPVGAKTKIHRLKDGSLFGASSAKVGNCERLRRLVEENGVEVTLSAPLDAQAILVRPDGTVFYFHEGDSWSGPLESDLVAIGSGEQFAIGAMRAGASALEAVIISIDCDPWSGDGFNWMPLSEAP